MHLLEINKEFIDECRFIINLNLPGRSRFVDNKYWISCKKDGITIVGDQIPVYFTWDDYDKHCERIR